MQIELSQTLLFATVSPSSQYMIQQPINVLLVLIIFPIVQTVQIRLFVFYVKLVYILMTLSLAIRHAKLAITHAKLALQLGIHAQTVMLQCSGFLMQIIDVFAKVYHIFKWLPHKLNASYALIG